MNGEATRSTHTRTIARQAQRLVRSEDARCAWGNGNVNVKTQALINAAGYVEEQHGREGLATLLQHCSPALRDRYMGAISIDWMPMSELVEVLEQVETVFGKGGESASRAIGARSARQNTRGLVARSLFYLASPNFLLRRIASLWSQFNDQGGMHLRHLDERSASIEVTGVPKPHRLFCATLTGWIQVISEAVGATGAKVEHTRCRARGHNQCLWAIQWDATQARDAYESGR